VNGPSTFLLISGIQDRRYRQAISAAGSGYMAALESEKHLEEHDAEASRHGQISCSAGHTGLMQKFTWESAYSPPARQTSQHSAMT
jgi:hypothetical protein